MVCRTAEVKRDPVRCGLPASPPPAFGGAVIRYLSALEVNKYEPPVPVSRAFVLEDYAGQ